MNEMVTNSSRPVSSLKRSDIDDDGFAISASLLSEGEQRALINAVGQIQGAGRRGVLCVAEVARFAHSKTLLQTVEGYTSAQVLPVRATYFDKSPEANWLVSWHQDLTLAVRGKIEVPGFGPWSIKNGVPHVQAPVEILEQMLAVRVHLDNCDESNGALRVLPGTHRLGRLSPERIRQLRVEVPEKVCCLLAGDALVMRPLLLHASGKSGAVGHRRVLHIEYASPELPGGLRWREE
jgi:ectoine hydroxylase-related dioxygenase (phytanoyl-CoA dioxygenase family)